jgi:hypothetical protein
VRAITSLGKTKEHSLLDRLDPNTMSEEEKQAVWALLFI